MPADSYAEDAATYRVPEGYRENGVSFAYIPGKRAAPDDLGRTWFGEYSVLFPDGEVVRLPHVGYPATASAEPLQFDLDRDARDRLEALARELIIDEVKKDLAPDTVELSLSIEEAERLWRALDRPEVHGPPYPSGGCIACSMERAIEEKLGVDHTHA